MKLKDDQGTHYVPEVFGITYVSMKEHKPYAGSRRRKSQWNISIGFGRDTELWLTYKKEKDAKATYDKVLKAMRKEGY